MHHYLREIAKVGVGLFIADIVCALWLGSAGFLPLTLLGVTWTSSVLLPGIVFDLVIIALLAHYGWNIKLPIASPSGRGLLMLVGIVFLVVALVHLARLMFGWDIVLGSVAVPLWLSWVGVLIAGYLSYSSFHFATRANR